MTASRRVAHVCSSTVEPRSQRGGERLLEGARLLQRGDCAYAQCLHRENVKIDILIRESGKTISIGVFNINFIN